jgi:hypothetical protein
MDQQLFTMLRDQHTETLRRFDKLESLHVTHVDDDKKVHAMVERHNMYFNIAFLGIPLLLTAAASKLGFK